MTDVPGATGKNSPQWLRDLLGLALTTAGHRDDRTAAFGAALAQQAFADQVTAIAGPHLDVGDGGGQDRLEAVRSHVGHYAEDRPELLDVITGTFTTVAALGTRLTVVITQDGPDVEVLRSESGDALELRVRGLTES